MQSAFKCTVIIMSFLAIASVVFLNVSLSCHLFGCTGSFLVVACWIFELLHMGSSLLTRKGTWFPGIGNTET